MQAPKNVEAMTGLGYDPAFGGLDLSAFVDFSSLPEDTSFHDPRFSQLDESGQGHGSAALKRFIVQQTAEHTPPTTVHANGNEFRVFFRNNAWHADGEVDGTRRRFSASDRDALLSRLGKVTNPRAKAPYRELNEQEQLEIARYVQGNDIQAALGQYLFFATDKREFATPYQILDDPRYRGLTDRAVAFIWHHARTDYSPTPEREQYIKAYAANRPLSIPLLNAAWEARRQEEKAGLREIKEREEPEEYDPEELNDLDDGEINKLMHQTRLQSARASRSSS
jgi:hypothetical protein